MSEAVALENAMNTGHGGSYSVTGFTATTANFKISGKKPLVMGDPMIVHILIPLPKTPHPGMTISGCSSKLRINGKPVATENDQTSCGDIIDPATCFPKFKC